jgi:hypothetical protein
MEWKDIHWKEVLDALAQEQIVVPVVGPDVLAVKSPDGRTLPFPLLLATRLAARLSAEERARLPEQPTLHEVAITPKWRGREAEFAADLAEVEEEALKQVLPGVLDQTQPSALRWLAEISDFPLYLTITPDTLFESVLAEVRGLTPKDVRTFYLRRERGKLQGDDKLDLPQGWERPKTGATRVPTLFYLYGRLGTEANFDVTDEQRLELLWRLQHEDYQPERLMRELRNGHILLLGTQMPDWIGRYFIRLLRGQRLVEAGGSVEALADSLVVAPGPPAPFVAFLDAFSQRTRLYRGGGAAQFIEELHRRWLDRCKGDQNKAPKLPPIPEIAAPPRDLEEDGCFISYRRADAQPAAALYQALREAGIPVWLDLEEIHGGDRIDDRIRPNVEGAAFFLPLLSGNTRRQGGYFRREWAWALSHSAYFTGMADRGYLRPIIVDSTPKAELLKDIPTEFASVHIEEWPQGRPTS